MRKEIMYIVGLLLMVSIAYSLGNNFWIDFGSGSVLINTSIIQGTKINCADVIGGTLNVCSGAGGTVNISGNVSYADLGGFSKTNETTYSGHGGFARSNLSGSSNISYDSATGQFWINMSIAAAGISYTSLGGFSKENETGYGAHGGWSSVNDSAALPTYSSLGGFSSANETSYANHGGFALSNWSTAYTANGWQSINNTQDNVIRSTNTTWITYATLGGFSKPNETNYANHGGFSLANLSGGSNISISSTGSVFINQSIYSMFTYAGLGGFTITNQSYSAMGGFNKANETSYANHGGFSLANLSGVKLGNTTAEIRSQFTGSPNISYDSSTGQFWINMSIAVAGGSGGGGIWIDGGDYVYLNNSVAEKINTTINYSQILNCKWGEYIAMVNGSVSTIRTIDEEEYNVKYRYNTNAYATDQEHFAIGLETGTNTFIRGVINFNITPYLGKTVKKATFKLVLSTYYDPSYLSYPKIYYNYVNPVFSYSSCTANKELCYNSTSLSTYLNDWSDIMFYRDGLGDGTIEKVPDYIDIDITDQLESAINAGNTTFQLILKMDTDNNQNYSISSDPGIEFISSTTWLNGDITPGIISSGNTQSRIVAWFAEPNELNYQCIETIDSQKWGRENPKPKISLSMLSTILNNSNAISINCSNIKFDSGLGSPSICDGVDATGAGASSSLPGDGTYIYNDTAYRFNETKLNSTIDLRLPTYSSLGGASGANLSIWNVIINTNTSWITANEKTYAQLGGFSSANETSYANHGGFALSNWSTAYAANGWQSINNTLDNVIRSTNTTWITYATLGGFSKSNETSYANHGGFSLANLSGGSNISISSTGAVFINQSIYSMFTYAGIGGFSLANQSYSAMGGFNKANETTYAGHGGFSQANLSLISAQTTPLNITVNNLTSSNGASFELFYNATCSRLVIGSTIQYWCK